MYLSKTVLNLFITPEWLVCKQGIRSQELEKMNPLTYEFKPLKSPFPPTPNP